MNIGTLQRSHLLPSALHKMVRGRGANPHPLHITAGRWQQSCEQDTAYLLCFDCEQRFHQNGENWVLAKLFRRQRQRFELLTLLETAETISKDGLTIYRVPLDVGINLNALAYFAASVIWKASVYQWRDDGEKITLGKYQEHFRRYLLGTASFPEEASLIVDVTRPENRIKEIVGGPMTSRAPNYFLHWFFTPGVMFKIAVGSMLPVEVRRLCALRQRIIVSSNHETDFRAAYRSMLT